MRESDDNLLHAQNNKHIDLVVAEQGVALCNLFRTIISISGTIRRGLPYASVYYNKSITVCVKITEYRLVSATVYALAEAYLI